MSESKLEPELPPDQESDSGRKSADEAQSAEAAESEHELISLGDWYRRDPSIVAARSISEFKLEASLSQYWDQIVPGAANIEEELQQHDPSEIVPLFETYVKQMLEACARQLLPLYSDGNTFSKELNWVILYVIISDIKPAQASIQTPSPAQWIKMLRQTSGPWAKTELERYLNENRGLWEVFVSGSFERHLSKNGMRPTLRSPESLFSLKYRFYLRHFEDWDIFNNRVKADLHVRISHWRAVADRHYAELAARNIEPAEPNKAQSSHPVSETSAQADRGAHISPGSQAPTVAEANEDGNAQSATPYPRRAVWLKARLRERGWTKYTLEVKARSPTRKTVEKILQGEEVRESTLDALATALSIKGPAVERRDIPDY